MKTHKLILIAAMLLGCSLLLGSEIEAQALTLRIEDAETHMPIAGVRVYRFFQTVRVQHFLGIKGIPSPESEFEFRVAEHYLTNDKGEVRLPPRRFAARLYERGVGDMLYINLIAPASSDDVRDAQAFAKNKWRILPDRHFTQSVTQNDLSHSGVILHLNTSLPDAAPIFDGAYAFFSLRRIGDIVIVGLAPSKDGQVDGRISTIRFGGRKTGQAAEIDLPPSKPTR